MIELKLDEARNLVDSRFVDVENQIENIKNHGALWNTPELLRQANKLADMTEDYAVAVNIVDDIEMEMETMEAEREYENKFGEEDD